MLQYIPKQPFMDQNEKSTLIAYSEYSNQQECHKTKKEYDPLSDFHREPRDIINIHDPININITALTGHVCGEVILYEVQIGLVDPTILVYILNSITFLTRIYDKLRALAGI